MPEGHHVLKELDGIMNSGSKPAKELGLITGMHRSGTTWIGKALSLTDVCSVLHEPLNYDFGVDGAPPWYPNAESKAERSNLADLFNRILDGSARYKVKRQSDPLLKAVARRLTGGPNNWNYRRAIQADTSHLVLKDPFCLLISLWLAKTYGFRVVILVRHPCAILNSFKRMSWPVPDLNANSSGTESYSAGKLEPLEYAARFGKFWRDLYSSAIVQVEQSEGRLLMIRHEDLCIDPLAHGQKVFDHLGIPMQSTASEFLIQSTSGKVITPEPGILHSMNRAAGEMVHSWKNRMLEDEISVVVESTGDLLERIYPS